LIFFRTKAGYTLFDQKEMKKFWEELKAEPLDEKMRRHKSNWLQHVTGMNNRMSKMMQNYRLN
jgi:hypothetical protein